jgi:23S rRNA (guanine2445-N2)-methyltransferase / 23S rRNA (guanine2069-N7)-methyltransferase
VQRLAKNLRHLGRFAARIGTDAYRVYDSDVPHFNAAIDVYAGRYVVSEYAPPKSIAPETAASRLRDVVRAVRSVFSANEDAIVVKQRRRQSPETQYPRLGTANEFHTVREGNARFLVNLSDRLDTGLFLDHRGTREWIAKHAAGKRVLNLFAYTGTATVAAALAGARSSVNVDWSNTYLEWAQRNFDLNELSTASHTTVKADCREYVELARDRFDLAIVDPPTFSNRSGVESDFEVQRDHVALLNGVAARLAHGGVILFSTHALRFELDAAALARFEIRDVTRATLHEDMRRSPRIHLAYVLQARAVAP